MGMGSKYKRISRMFTGTKKYRDHYDGTCCTAASDVFLQDGSSHPPPGFSKDGVGSALLVVGQTGNCTCRGRVGGPKWHHHHPSLNLPFRRLVYPLVATSSQQRLKIPGVGT